MVRSMTGFGRAEGSQGELHVTVEARSVNNRFLAVKTRLPPRFAGADAVVEDVVRKSVERGSVDVSVRVAGKARHPRLSIDTQLARTYLREIERLVAETHVEGALDLHALLQLPGVVNLEESNEAADDEVAMLRDTVRQALTAMVALRSAEGARLATELRSILDRIRKLVDAIAARAAQVPVEAKARLTKRVEKLLSGSSVTLDAGTLERESALIADRSDVTEELARLASHLDAFESALSTEGSVGRTLDFVVQEMGRETITIGSKTQDVALCRDVIALKAELERVREQVQNIE